MIDFCIKVCYYSSIKREVGTPSQKNLIKYYFLIDNLKNKCYNKEKLRKEVLVMRINFDMDGTIANFYGVEGWLDYLIASDSTPYRVAKPLINMSVLARLLNKLQKNGYEIAIISWLSKNGTDEFNREVIEVKKAWLKKHLASVNFDKITIVPYGTPKQNYCNNSLDILFDDEKPNRDNWMGKAYGVENIIEILKRL